MPAKSKSQQRAAGMALSAKRGDMDPKELKGAAKEMYDSMSEKELEDFAKTDHDGLPDKVEESNEKLYQLGTILGASVGTKFYNDFYQRDYIQDPKTIKSYLNSKGVNIDDENFN
jgi:hypothetical protein